MFTSSLENLESSNAFFRIPHGATPRTCSRL